MGTFYRDAIARQGRADAARAIHDAWQSGDRERAVAAVADDLLDALAAAGTPERAREALDRFAAVDGVDAVAVTTPRGATSEEVRETLTALAP